MDDGYPDEDELRRIREWPHEGGFPGLMDFVRERWAYADWGWTVDGETKTYRISTGGWSGNESLVEALQENTMFWTLCWESSRRGGHYEFSPIVPGAL